MHSNMIRKLIIDISHKSSASHIASSLSCVEILDSVYSSVDIDKIKRSHADRDRIILSKGHAACALYSTMCAYGLIDRNELSDYCKNGSKLAGHATHNIKYVEHSTGALGHGLSIALGVAVGLKALDLSGRVFCIVGDGEMNEGSNWEALMFAGSHKINNLCLLIDNNQLAGIGDTICVGGPNLLADKIKAFGFDVAVVDVHDENVIKSAMQRKDRPLAIICNTVKGKGISFMENENVWHYRPINDDDFKRAMEELNGE